MGDILQKVTDLLFEQGENISARIPETYGCPGMKKPLHFR